MTTSTRSTRTTTTRTSTPRFTRTTTTTRRATMTRMITSFSRIAGVLALVVALTGASCSTPNTTKGLVVSGETIAGIGDQFAALGGVYTKQCTPQISNPAFVSFCKSFKEYGPKFQTAYPLAVQTFK